VGVTVIGPDGQFVDGLRKENFDVFDDGVEQQIAYFSLEDLSQVVLLIEAGPAVYLLEGGHLRAAHALLAGLSETDQVAVVQYAERPVIVSAFNADKNASESALKHLNFNLGFGDLNLSESIASVLDWLDKPSGKKTIVLLSTGLDTSLPSIATELKQRLRVGDVRVLAVSLAGELRGPTANKKKKTPPPTAAQQLAGEQFAVADKELKELTEATGGRAYFPTNAQEFDEAYAQIAQIVRHEYNLGFVPQRTDGKVHSLEVRVNSEAEGRRNSQMLSVTRPGLRVDHRQAYVARVPMAP
jgi:Ca-activated chloride channel homolog